MLSIIIPTLNEEKYLPRLLESIKKQSFRDYEIIVADAGSQDRTVEIAKSYGCKVVSGGLPAKGRNQGAAATSGDLFLFLDGEVLLPDNFLDLILAEFKARNLDLAGCCHEPIGTSWVPRFVPTNFLYNLLYNWPIKFLEDVFPFASSLILVKRGIHEKLGGFDEDVRIGEDHNYVRRGMKIGKFGILRSAKLPLFLRRDEKKGIIRTNLIYLFCLIYNVLSLGADLRTDIIRYDFGGYDSIDPPPKTNFIFQALWYLVLYFLVVVGLFIWFITFLIFTPKIVTRYLKSHFKHEPLN